ncbi:MAG: heavy-metal-associated domain-containing protein [Armatimonadetes bacterium]|nr:heavy-metal-associated domain-containing protein [Armatimonadota bacterium]
MKAEFSVTGMMCNNCVNHVKVALEKFGASEVEIDLASGAVSAEIGEKSKEEVAEVIREEGYEVAIR